MVDMSAIVTICVSTFFNPVYLVSKNASGPFDRRKKYHPNARIKITKRIIFQLISCTDESSFFLLQLHAIYYPTDKKIAAETSKIAKIIKSIFNNIGKGSDVDFFFLGLYGAPFGRSFCGGAGLAIDGGHSSLGQILSQHPSAAIRNPSFS
jgi:hypothetical protein